MTKSRRALVTLGALGATFLLTPALAQKLAVSPAQEAQAREIANKGVALADLATDAPARYTVKSGDTLWSISSLFLKSPWRWPELWGANLQDVGNPHRIYPGQTLILERGAESASLRLDASGRPTRAVAGRADDADEATAVTGDLVRVSPRTRITSLLASPLPALKPNVIEPFLAEPLIVDINEFDNAPRIVAGKEARLVLASGDRAYARGPAGMPMLDDQPKTQYFRIYGQATALRHPDSGQILGYEAKFVGKAALAKGERLVSEVDEKGVPHESIIAAAIDITSAKAEISIGDRLIPATAAPMQSYTPHAPAAPMESRIVSVYGTAVTNAAQNQVVAISSGTLDGVDNGTVLAILKNGATLIANTDGKSPSLKLPDERIGLVMVFRAFEHISYALILEIVDGVRVGDRLISPQ